MLIAVGHFQDCDENLKYVYKIAKIVFNNRYLGIINLIYFFIYMYIYIYILVRSNRPVVFCKKVFLNILQNSKENTCARASFLIKLQASGLRPLLKKRLWLRCFPVDFVKFLRTPYLQYAFRWLFLSRAILNEMSHLWQNAYNAVMPCEFPCLPYWFPWKYSFAQLHYWQGKSTMGNFAVWSEKLKLLAKSFKYRLKKWHWPE